MAEGGVGGEVDVETWTESGGSASSFKGGSRNQGSALEEAPAAAFHYKDVRRLLVMCAVVFYFPWCC